VYPCQLDNLSISRLGKSSVERVFSDDLKPDGRERSGKKQSVYDKQSKVIMSTKLYVGNLSYNTTENQLQDMFGAHGPVTSVDLIMDKFSGRPRGFGFVTMETKEGAEAAVQALNGKNVDGRDLTVNEARPREERAPRSGGGGGGGGYRGGGGGGGGDRGGRREYSR
jgi:cold-inducible RNA-binding protein